MFLENLLLTSDLARGLYDSVATLPIIDFHNHLSIKDIVKNRQFQNLSELWIDSDPYKHRAMRICGVPEHIITGKETSPKERFLAWATVAPQLLGNPLWNWSRLELARIFGIEEELTPTTAEAIWEKTSAQLATPEYTTRAILEHFPIEYSAPCCTLFSQDASLLKPFPGWTVSLRGDDLLSPTSEQLASLSNALDALNANGCRIADHALDAGFHYEPDQGNDEELFACTSSPQQKTSAMLRRLGAEYAKRGWLLQLHIGALRRTSDRLRQVAGPAGGYAAIGHPCDLASVVAFLNDMEKSPAGLPRTILYTLNPNDHAALATLAGSFPGDGTFGKVQLGPAWWLCDHLSGIHDCLDASASYGVLAAFPGMTTDSRSILSFVRHEFFRRAFCAWLAKKVARDEMPNDFARLTSLARKVCYQNAKNFLKINHL